MVVMVLRKVVRQHLTVEAIERVDICAAETVGRHPFPSDQAMTVDQDGLVAFPKTKRLSVYIGETEGRGTRSSEDCGRACKQG
jgi:hypothetical protein